MNKNHPNKTILNIENFFQRNIKYTFIKNNSNLPANNEEQKKTLTIGVITYNRYYSLTRFLDSLKRSINLIYEVIIVDASEGNLTQNIVENFFNENALETNIKYFRVSGEYKGACRQKNFLTRFCETDWVVFFDDDIILLEDTIPMIIKAIENYKDDESVIMLGCRLTNEIFDNNLPIRWKIRFFLRLSTQDDAGKFLPYGMAIPTSLLAEFQGYQPVDILRAGATVYRTKLFNFIKFNEKLDQERKSYALGEDIEFSLNAQKFGKKLLIGESKVIHMHDESSRLSIFEYGKQVSRHQIYFMNKYSQKSIINSLKFLSWQFLDLIIAISQAVLSGNVENYKYFFGRVVGFLRNPLLKTE